MSSAPQFWCHSCRKIIRPSDDFLCPECRGDFIETLDEEDSAANFVPFTNTESQPTATPSQPTPMTGHPNPTAHEPFSQMFSQLCTAMQQRHAHRSNAYPSPSMSNSANNFSQSFPSTSNPSMDHSPNTTTANFMYHTNVDRTPRYPPTFFAHSNNLTHSFNQMFNHVFGLRSINPGDYAWGRNFEDVLNQLFQSGGRQGNPPASQSALDQLPKFSIQQQHLDECLDCTICKDDFKLNDMVIQLPCKHYFHPDCVTTWLKLHNQCPVCRFELPTEDKEYEERRRSCYGCPSSNRRCHRQ